ncbi:MAG: hypothetical protein RJA33_928 [Actinomycetota bacterium]|jgi:pyridoxal phosphate enzyme (YggS family)
MTDRRLEIEENLAALRAEIAPFNPTLVAVTKTYPVSDVAILKSCGINDFGENRNEEGLEKAPEVQGRWHYQGELQSKKLRSILSWADVIHSLDEARHAARIEQILSETGGQIDLFIQLSLDGDPSRGGVTIDALGELADSVLAMSHITLLGIMCVPPVDQNPERAFAQISSIHHNFSQRYPESRALSAGMSGDYLLALEHGATHIRVGSKILGPRLYPQ